MPEKSGFEGWLAQRVFSTAHGPALIQTSWPELPAFGQSYRYLARPNARHVPNHPGRPKAPRLQLFWCLLPDSGSPLAILR